MKQNCTYGFEVGSLDELVLEVSNLFYFGIKFFYMYTKIILIFGDWTLSFIKVVLLTRERRVDGPSI